MDMVFKELVAPLTGEITGKKFITGDINMAKYIYEKDYELLDNKPQIESVELIGNKSLEEIGIDRLTNSEIEEIFTR